MIQLFVALPAVSMAAEDSELVYLKQLASQDVKEVERLLQKALKGVKITCQDEKVVFFDNSRFNDLMDFVKKVQWDKDNKENPDVVRLRRLMTDWHDCNSQKDTFTPVKVNDVEQKKGLFCAFANIRQSGRDVIMDVEAVRNVKGLRMSDANGKNLDINVIDGTEETVYAWLVKNRDPERRIDKNYEKHSEKEKEFKKGTISASTYPKEKSEKMLQWAVGSLTNKSNRLYFHDLEGKKLLIFWNEDGQGKLFHAYEVSEDNNDELQKIWTYDDGRSLKEAIDRIAKVYSIVRNG